MISNYIPYKLFTLTKSHVGSGERNRTFIDKLIAKDYNNDFPIFPESGVKGGIKEFVDSYSRRDDKNKMMKSIFGSSSEQNHGSKNKNHGQGQVSFTDSYLLAVPVRCKEIPFLWATCPAMLKNYNLLNQLTNTNTNLEIPICCNQVATELNVIGFVKNRNLLTIETFDVSITNKPTTDFDQIVNLIGVEPENLLILSDTLMKQLLSNDNLPVKSRNVLEDGESKNLWFEQYLPRFSILYTFIGYPKNNNEVENLQSFLEDLLIKNNLQLGGNSSLSQGICKVTKLA